MTTNQMLAALPGNVTIPAELSGLPEESVANITQIVTVDRAALGDVTVGTLPNWLLSKIDDGLRLALGLT